MDGKKERKCVMLGDIGKIDRSVGAVLLIIFVIGALTGSNIVMAAMPIAAILYLVIRFRFDFVISLEVDEEVLEPKAKPQNDSKTAVARYHEDYEEKRKRK